MNSNAHYRPKFFKIRIEKKTRTEVKRSSSISMRKTQGWLGELQNGLFINFSIIWLGFPKFTAT